MAELGFEWAAAELENLSLIRISLFSTALPNSPPPHSLEITISQLARTLPMQFEINQDPAIHSICDLPVFMIRYVTDMFPWQ